MLDSSILWCMKSITVEVISGCLITAIMTSVVSLKDMYKHKLLYNSYTTFFPPVRGDNPQALANGLFPEQVDKPLFNYFTPPLSM